MELSWHNISTPTIVVFIMQMHFNVRTKMLVSYYKEKMIPSKAGAHIETFRKILRSLREYDLSPNADMNTVFLPFSHIVRKTDER